MLVITEPIIGCTNATCVCYGMVCASVREENPGAFASVRQDTIELVDYLPKARGLSSRTDAKTYNNILIAPACICILCIVRYLM